MESTKRGGRGQNELDREKVKEIRPVFWSRDIGKKTRQEGERGRVKKKKKKKRREGGSITRNTAFRRKTPNESRGELQVGG